MTPRILHNIALIGFMGSGKSSVGQVVATHLQFRFVDTDDLIERHASKSITRIFADDGEARFRELEAEVVRDLARHQRLVIATGGGLAAHPGNLESLRQHAFIVCLWARAETIWERVRRQSHRPLLRTPDPEARIRDLLATRERHYREADVLIGTEFRSIREVALQVVQQFRSAASSPPTE